MGIHVHVHVFSSSCKAVFEPATESVVRNVEFVGAEVDAAGKTAADGSFAPNLLDTPSGDGHEVAGSDWLAPLITEAVPSAGTDLPWWVVELGAFSMKNFDFLLKEC